MVMDKTKAQGAIATSELVTDEAVTNEAVTNEAVINTSEIDTSEIDPSGIEQLAINGGEPACQVNFGPRWVFDDRDRAQLDMVMNRAVRVWRSGDKLREFQRIFAQMHGASFQANPTGSGTAAIHAAVGSLELDPGDEIITTPATDIGSLIGILSQNLIPVFADWLPGTFNTDPAEIERKITERTRAILVVHLFGVPCDMDPIMAIAQRYSLTVIEDCAQSILAEYNGRKVGTIGDIAGFSFGLKTLSTDQGGMVMTGDKDRAAQVRGFLSKGSELQGKTWRPFAKLGSFAPMTDLQAAIGVAQLAKLEQATQARRMVAELLDEVFDLIPAIRTAPERPGDRNVYYVYPYHLDQEQAGMALPTFVEALRAEGVQDAFGPYLHGRSLHRAPIFSKPRTYGRSGYPFQEKGIAQVDYGVQSFSVIEQTLPELGFFHMRNSFTLEQGEAIAAAIHKVAKGYGLIFPSIFVPPLPSQETIVQETEFQDTDVQDLRRMGKTNVCPSESGLDGHVLPSFAHPTSGNTPDTLFDKSTTLATTAQLPSHQLSTHQGLDFRHFGANGEAGRAGAAQNDAAMAALLETVEHHGRLIFIPRGEYYFAQPIRLRGLRNLRFVGEGGNPVNVGTRLIYIGDDPDGLMDLATVLHCGFEAIEFVNQSVTAEQVINLRSDGAREDGLATSDIDFVACTFRSSGIDQIHPSPVGVRLRDSANIVFRQCWFMSCHTGVHLGHHMQKQVQSRSNGLANNVLFQSCRFFADITGTRASNVRFADCMFSKKSNGTGAHIDFGDTSSSGVQSVTVMNCFAIESQQTPTPFFTQGEQGRGLMFQANRIAGYQVAVYLNGHGYAMVCANQFAQTAQGSTDIWIGANAVDVVCQANDSQNV